MTAIILADFGLIFIIKFISQFILNYVFVAIVHNIIAHVKYRVFIPLGVGPGCNDNHAASVRPVNGQEGINAVRIAVVLIYIAPFDEILRLAYAYALTEIAFGINGMFGQHFFDSIL